jgi:hypothetical protein
MSFAHSATIATLTRYHSSAKQQQQYGGIIATLTRYHSTAKQQQQYVEFYIFDIWQQVRVCLQEVILHQLVTVQS